MKPVFSVAKMQEADSKTIKLLNGNGILLMEHAGTACVKAIQNKFKNNLKNKNILIICGKGNNGGDGIVIARQLISENCKVKVFVLDGELSKDCNFQLKILNNYTDNIEFLKEGKLNSFKKALISADILVDALLGTGLTKKVKGVYKTIIDSIKNDYKNFIVSVDIPSGISGDFGIVSENYLTSDMTITFGALKKCHVFEPAASMCGEILVNTITIPKFVFDDVDSKLVITEKDDLIDLKNYNNKNTHKGTFGHVGIIGGEKGKLGASILAAISALKSGAGLVTIFTSLENYKTVSSFYPEIMFHIFEKYSDSHLEEFLENKSSICLGPGLGVNEFSKTLIKKISNKFNGNIVLDADVFRNFNIGEFKKLNFKNRTVITPHPGEMAQFIGKTNSDVQNNRIEIVNKVAKELNLITILKGYQTLISNKGEKIYINPTGSPALSTAGSGDVLAGIISSLLAQGHNLIDSAITAVYLHGLAGNIAEKIETRACVTASSIIEYLGEAILK